MNNYDPLIAHEIKELKRRVEGIEEKIKHHKEQIEVLERFKKASQSQIDFLINRIDND